MHKGLSPTVSPSLGKVTSIGPISFIQVEEVGEGLLFWFPEGTIMYCGFVVSVIVGVGDVAGDALGF